VALESLIVLTAYLAPALPVVAVIFFVAQLVLRYMEKEDRFSNLVNALSVLLFAGGAFGCYIAFQRGGGGFYATAADISILGFFLSIATDALFGYLERRGKRREREANRPVVVLNQQDLQSADGGQDSVTPAAGEKKP
jgi:uncharacterized membrane protein